MVFGDRMGVLRLVPIEINLSVLRSGLSEGEEFLVLGYLGRQLGAVAVQFCSSSFSLLIGLLWKASSIKESLVSPCIRFS